ncbi:MAG: hypothetical protein ACR2QF_09185 [Geminicoccaceae bacterium]
MSDNQPAASPHYPTCARCAGPNGSTIISTCDRCLADDWAYFEDIRQVQDAETDARMARRFGGSA